MTPLLPIELTPIGSPTVRRGLQCHFLHQGSTIGQADQAPALTCSGVLKSSHLPMVTFCGWQCPSIIHQFWVVGLCGTCNSSGSSSTHCFLPIPTKFVDLGHAKVCILGGYGLMSCAEVPLLISMVVIGVVSDSCAAAVSLWNRGRCGLLTFGGRPEGLRQECKVHFFVKNTPKGDSL